MKPGDREYDLYVQRLLAEREAKRMHKVTQLTEIKCAQEVKDIVGDAFDDMKPGQVYHYLPADSNTGIPIPNPTGEPAVVSEPKRRGRPKGSKNKPKA